MDREEYQRTMEEKLSTLGAKLDQMTEGAKDAAADARRAVSETVGQLRFRRDGIARDLDELRHSSGEAWQHLRIGMDRSWDELQEGFKRAVSELKQ